MLRYITNKPECCFYKQNESGIYDTRLLHEILIEKNRFYCFSNSKPNCNPSLVQQRSSSTDCRIRVVQSTSDGLSQRHQLVCLEKQAHLI